MYKGISFVEDALLNIKDQLRVSLDECKSLCRNVGSNLTPPSFANS